MHRCLSWCFQDKPYCGSNVRVTEKQLISALSRYIVNNYPMTKINRLTTSRIRKSMNRSRFYFIVQSLLGKRKEKKQKLTSQREKLPSAILFCVYSCLVLCPRVFSVLFSIGITLLWKKVAGICASLHLFVYFAHVKFCHLSLPFDVRG